MRFWDALNFNHNNIRAGIHPCCHHKKRKMDVTFLGSSYRIRAESEKKGIGKPISISTESASHVAELELTLNFTFLAPLQEGWLPGPYYPD